MLATEKGRAEVVDTLIEHGARVDLKEEVPNYYISIFDTTKICLKAVYNYGYVHTPPFQCGL